jgi:ketosteroid isomerase-like protein
MKFYFILLILLVFISCNRKNSKEYIEHSKKEIVQTENEFCQYAAQKGVPEAFYQYADSAANIHRGNRIIHGKDSILVFYKKQNFKNISLQWKPDFVEVSTAGDLGYTFGNYVYATIDSTGKSNESKGIFHTVWKRQSDGTWKYVWD